MIYSSCQNLIGMPWLGATPFTSATWKCILRDENTKAVKTFSNFTNIKLRWILFWTWLALLIVNMDRLLCVFIYVFALDLKCPGLLTLQIFDLSKIMPWKLIERKIEHEKGKKYIVLGSCGIILKTSPSLFNPWNKVDSFCVFFLKDLIPFTLPLSPPPIACFHVPYPHCSTYTTNT